MVLSLARACKNAILPKGKQFRKLRFGPASGCTMQIDFRHHMGLYLGLYERELEPYFRALVRKGDKCFDVGGQGGYDALIMAKLSGGGPVVSFESDPDAAEEMRETFARNPFSVQTIEAFVGDRNDARHVSLEVAASQTFVPDFIKMDIEGAEVEALLGAGSILSEQRPDMLVEVHGRDQERRCLQILSSYGYALEIVDQRTWLKDHRPLEHNRWLVCRGREGLDPLPRLTLHYGT